MKIKLDIYKSFSSSVELKKTYLHNIYNYTIMEYVMQKADFFPV